MGKGKLDSKKVKLIKHKGKMVPKPNTNTTNTKQDNPTSDFTTIHNNKPKSNNSSHMFDFFDSNILEKFDPTNNNTNYNGKGSHTTSWNYSKLLETEKEYNNISRKQNKEKYKEKNNINTTDMDIDEDETQDNTNANNKSEVNDYDNDLEKFETALFEKDCSFSDFALSKLILKALADGEFFHPTKVQARVIPLILQLKDVLVNAETGSGKTACYLIPTIQRILSSKFNSSNNSYKALLILPTRELAMQCSQMLECLLKYLNETITYATITGGMSVQAQTSKLLTQPDLVLATPGRLIDMIYNYKSINLDYINILILDEADKLLELGFKDAIVEIINKITGITNSSENKNKSNNTKKRSNLQTLLFFSYSKY